ncbi:MAG: GTPase ObgE [Pseudomonadota bacterium]
MNNSRQKGFWDEAVINAQSGDGGRGCISFRREKFIPRGGPDGGDGGRGGSVIIRTVKGIYTLAEFSSRKHFKAQNGRPGRGKNQTGKDGKDILIDVPLGTEIYDQETGELLADLTAPNQEFVFLEGGKGGRGNQHFATSTNRAPRKAQPGLPGEGKRFRLSLKYIADIGLIGLPNTGKSTLLSRLTMARPKIDNYPFTTLVPHLGIISFDDERGLILAEIPGLIEGASQGKGLGHRFLKHAERTKLLLHLLDITSTRIRDLLEDFYILRKEMEAYNLSLIQKQYVVLINKIDLVPKGDKDIRRIKEELDSMGVESLPISALTGEGLDNLRDILSRKFFNGREKQEREDIKERTA